MPHPHLPWWSDMTECSIERKTESNVKGWRAACPVLGKENQAQVPRVNSTRSAWGHLDMRLHGYGTGFQTRSEQQSPILNSEDVAFLDWPYMQMPSMYDIMFVPLLMFVLCLIFVFSFLSLSFQFCFISSVHVLFQTFWSCMFYCFFVLLWHNILNRKNNAPFFECI